jgi:hypothetical protein
MLLNIDNQTIIPSISTWKIKQLNNSNKNFKNMVMEEILDEIEDGRRKRKSKKRKSVKRKKSTKRRKSRSKRKH